MLKSLGFFLSITVMIVLCSHHTHARYPKQVAEIHQSVDETIKSKNKSQNFRKKRGSIYINLKEFFNKLNAQLKANSTEENRKTVANMYERFGDVLLLVKGEEYHSIARALYIKARQLYRQAGDKPKVKDLSRKMQERSFQLDNVPHSFHQQKVEEITQGIRHSLKQKRSNIPPPPLF